MKTTDNTTKAQWEKALADSIYWKREAKRWEELTNATEAQRDTALAALRDLLVQYKKGTCTIDTYYCNQAREAIAASQGGAE